MFIYTCVRVFIICTHVIHVYIYIYMRTHTYIQRLEYVDRYTELVGELFLGGHLKYYSAVRVISLSCQHSPTRRSSVANKKNADIWWTFELHYACLPPRSAAEQRRPSTDPLLFVLLSLLSLLSLLLLVVVVVV